MKDVYICTEEKVLITQSVKRFAYTVYVLKNVTKGMFSNVKHFTIMVASYPFYLFVGVCFDSKCKLGHVFKDDVGITSQKSIATIDDASNTLKGSVLVDNVLITNEDKDILPHFDQY